MDPKLLPDLSDGPPGLRPARKVQGFNFYQKPHRRANLVKTPTSVRMANSDEIVRTTTFYYQA